MFHTYAARVCSKRFICFQSYVATSVFVLQVASVLFGYCICYSGYTHILQVYVTNVLVVSDVCCKCFIWMSHILQWLYTLLQAYVSNVSPISDVF